MPWVCRKAAKIRGFSTLKRVLGNEATIDNPDVSSNIRRFSTLKRVLGNEAHSVAYVQGSIRCFSTLKRVLGNEAWLAELGARVLKPFQYPKAGLGE